MRDLTYTCSKNRMNTSTIESADPKVHSNHIQEALQELIDHARKDLDRVEEPRFQALLETAAEVLIGLKTAFDHYNKGE